LVLPARRSEGSAGTETGNDSESDARGVRKHAASARIESLYHDVEIGLIPVANVLIKLTDMHVRVQEKTALEDEIAKLQEQRRILKSMIDMRDFETLRLRCLRLKVMKLKRMKVKRIKSKLKRLAMTVTQMA
jgi:hypothetical protein